MSPTSPRRLLLALHTYGNSFIHVPNLLARTGFSVDAVFTSRHPLLGVSRISNCYVAEPHEWAATIQSRLLSHEYSLFLNVDEPGVQALYEFAWHPEAIRYLPFTPGSAVAATVGSKSRFYDWCRSNALPIPETHACANFSEACALQKTLPGAWLLKGDFGSGGHSVMRSSDEAGSHLNDVQRNQTWLVQRHEGSWIGSGIFLADRGVLQAWIGIRKIVCLNKGYGPTVLGTCELPPKLGELCASVAAASEVTGLTGFDFVKNADGQLLIIDSHLGRMSPMVHFDRLCGVNFSETLKSAVDGLPYCANAPVNGGAFVKFPEIVQLIMQEGPRGIIRRASFPLVMPIAPRGDSLIALRTALAIFLSQVRVKIGAWRRKLAPRANAPDFAVAKSVDGE